MHGTSLLPHAEPKLNCRARSHGHSINIDDELLQEMQAEWDQHQAKKNKLDKQEPKPKRQKT